MTIVQQGLQDAPYVSIPAGQLVGLPIPDIRLPELISPAPDGGIAIVGPEGLEVPAADPIPAAPDPASPALPASPAEQSAAAASGSEPTGDIDQPDSNSGETRVKEVAADSPFSVVALTGADIDTLAAYVRAQLADGGWGPWYPLEMSEGENPELATASRTVTGTEPIYVGETSRVQFLTVSGDPEHADEQHAHEQAAAEGELLSDDGADATPVEYRPASFEQAPDQLVDALQAVLINTGVSHDESGDGDYQAVAQSFSGSPQVITRAEWGADESQRCAPSYDSSIGGATVHHTAGSNDYSRSESAGILRAIYQYHTQTLDWCDVGYHALVDKYGQIFEGRAGGIDRPVRGSHAGGFNQNTVGIAMMGDLSRVAPSEAMLQSVGRYLGWRLDLAGLNPQGWATMYSEGTRFTFVPRGEAIRLPIIFGHRDVGRTSCPGDVGYAALPRIRQIAADCIENKNSPAATTTAPTTSGTEADQLASDGTTTTPTTGTSIPGEESVRDLAAGLLAALDNSPVVQRWLQAGGEDGFLGQALTGLLSGPDGSSYADFTGGSIYGNAAGETALVLGRILEEFRALGGALGILGPPLGDEYAVPEGRRSDFRNGSLIYNRANRSVTRLVTPPEGAASDGIAPDGAASDGGAPEDGAVGAPAPEASAAGGAAPPAVIDEPVVTAPVVTAPVVAGSHVPEGPLQPVE